MTTQWKERQAITTDVQSKVRHLKIKACTDCQQKTYFKGYVTQVVKEKTYDEGMRRQRTLLLDINYIKS